MECNTFKPNPSPQAAFSLSHSFLLPLFPVFSFPPSYLLSPISLAREVLCPLDSDIVH